MTTTTVVNTDSLPTLTEMGVTRPTEISSYTLRADGKKKDVLKIRYKRAKGSFLPHSRTYKFGRSLKAIVADGGTSRIENTYEISPLLLRAVAELDSLGLSGVDAKGQKAVNAARHGELLAELDALEVMLAADTAQTNPSAVSARLAKIKALVASL